MFEGDILEDDEVQEIPRSQAKGISIKEDGAASLATSTRKGKRKATVGMDSYFAKLQVCTQMSIKACLQSPKKWHEIDMATA